MNEEFAQKGVNPEFSSASPLCSSIPMHFGAEPNSRGEVAWGFI
jgi:hypothetical protein